MSRGTFDVVLSDDVRVTLPLTSSAEIDLHPDPSDFVGTMEELAAVPGVSLAPFVGPGFEAVNAILPNGLRVLVFVPNELRYSTEPLPAGDPAVESVRKLIPEVSS